MEEVIVVENLSKRYRLGVVGSGTLRDDAEYLWKKITGRISEEDASEKYHDALKDVSFTVRKGEVVGLIGKNGAGKSTLLKILSKVTAPTAGRAKIKGRLASLLEVGTGFHPELTGLENIYLNGAILGMSRSEIRRKQDEIIEFAGVEKYIHTPVKRYSSGMYVRLAFAVAAHLEPDILVVDEVLAVGDIEFQKKCLGKMGEVSQKEGRTIIFVSHNMQAIKRLCGRAILLDQGKIILDSSVDKVVEKYLASFEFYQKNNNLKISSPNSSGIFLKKILLLNNENKESFSFFFKENIKLFLEIECNHSILEQVVIILYFSDSEGNQVSMYSSDMFGKTLKLHKNTNLIEIVLENNFLENTYYISLCISKYRNGEDLLYLENVIKFNATNFPLDSSGNTPFLRWNKFGYFLNNSISFRAN